MNIKYESSYYTYMSHLASGIAKYLHIPITLVTVGV